MQSSFKGRLQNVNGYGDQPFTFVDPDAHRVIGHIASIDLIENGEKRAREYWQKKQLSNLVNHAYSELRYLASADSKRAGPTGRLAELSDPGAQGHHGAGAKGRFAVRRQKAAKHRDLRDNGLNRYAAESLRLLRKTATTTSSAALAQYFFDDLPLNENRVQITPLVRAEDLLKQKTILQHSSPDWAGPLSKLYQNGSNKILRFNQDIDGLLKEISRDRVGYLVSPSRVLEQLLAHGGPDLIKGLGIRAWIHLSDYRSPDLVAQLKAIGIPSLSNYSSGETGPIAFECRHNEGYYHVAHSNVVVECDRSLTTTYENETVGRLLITHLHSYATPIIRYDIGDFGKLHDQCPCGHDGPTISHIFGRGKHFLRHPDGKYMAFPSLDPRCARSRRV